MIYSHSFEIHGKSMNLEVGRVAKQAGGSVLLGMGDTVVLGTATMSKSAKPGIDFLPLTCDYEERKYAVGKIPGGFIKRGGRPSEKAILTSRLMDRPLRPLFPKGMRHDVQVMAMPFAVDQECPPDVLAINAAGVALAVSDIPFKYPVAGVRVGMIEDEFVLFPSIAQIKESKLDLVVAGHKYAISMVEAGASEVTEEVMHKALIFAHDAIKIMVAEFEKFASTAGKTKREIELQIVDADLKKRVMTEYESTIMTALGSPDKASRESAIDELIKETVARFSPDYADQPELLAQLPEAADATVKACVRKMILESGKRVDGRSLTDIRPLEAVAGLLPKVHGSGLFTRGQTQVMTIATLGLPGDAQTLDGLEDEDPKRYMHFYNFPSYSVGEVRPNRGPGRREVGHGALAERALRSVIPLDDPEFPYTMLLVSECMESNGSTSMASVCGSTLALMDAGIQIKAPVAGIAMGLMSDGEGKFSVLTDIMGLEDFCGDMDFKVAGTRDGITALQLDTKLEGIPDEVLARALNQAKDARFRILDVIQEAIEKPREEINANAPRVTTIQIPVEKIGTLIGPGGATIKKIVATTGASVDVQQDGRVMVGGTEGTTVTEAINMIKALTDEVGVGAEFTGKVSRLMGRGAMVEYMPGREGLVPVEHLTTKQIRRPDDVVQVGDEINVKVFEVDNMGRINLTAMGIKQSHPNLSENETATPPASQPRERGDRGGRGGDRGGRGGDRDRGRGGDRGGRGGDRDRGPRGDRPDRGERNNDRGNDRGERPDRAAVEFSDAPVEVPTEFPKRDNDDENVNARFRPRR